MLFWHSPQSVIERERERERGRVRERERAFFAGDVLVFFADVSTPFRFKLEANTYLRLRA